MYIRVKFNLVVMKKNIAHFVRLVWYTLNLFWCFNHVIVLDSEWTRGTC